jgi:protein-tyrosine-phosphatase
VAEEPEVKILFVCSGNICRSPMAAECLRHRLARGGPEGVVVDSAGTLGIEGAPASPEAIRALREVGVELSGHLSKGLRADDLATSDLVVAMTDEHLVELALRFPESVEQRLLLRAFEKRSVIAPAAPDLPDPIGKPLEFYREQVALIRSCIDNLARYLHRRIGA